MERKIIKQVRGFRTEDGAGVSLVRVLGHETVQEYDPVLLLDSFDSTNPSDYTAGFPLHPHRGIETISYVYRGKMTHRDSLGNEDTIGDGEVQWMTAGSGMFKGNKGYTSRYLPLDYYDIHLNPGPSLYIDTERERSVMVFTLSGDAYIGGELTKEKTAVKLSPGDYAEIKATDKSAQILFVSSTLLSEPVAWGGPIVMNTREELNTAFDDLKRGTFLKSGISY